MAQTCSWICYCTPRLPIDFALKSSIETEIYLLVNKYYQSELIDLLSANKNSCYSIANIKVTNTSV